MKILILVFSIMIYSSSGLAGDAVLTAKAVHYVFEASPAPPRTTEPGPGGQVQSPQTWRLSLIILIRNTGNRAVRIATHPNGSHYLSGPKGSRVTLITENQANPWDAQVVVPESDLGIVGLEPGEAALVRHTEITVEYPPKLIDVKYIIKNEIGDRLNIWSGELAMASEEGKVEK
jgi:hypothetical protein